jgi:ligand-binding SRPBCC domain-containing protein
LCHRERSPDAGKLSHAARRLRTAQRVDRAQHELGTLSCLGLPARCQCEQHEGGQGDALHSSQNIEPMASIRVETLIKAPIDRCFDLARSVEDHVASTAKTNERVVSGKMEGLFELGDSVTWEARHFGLRLRQGSTITRSEPPHVFVDEGTTGPLGNFRHVHQFVSEHGATLMVDTFEYELPARMGGRLADRLVVERHMRRLLTDRAAYLKQQAEAGG